MQSKEKRVLVDRRDNPEHSRHSGQVCQAAAKQLWMRFEGRSRIIEIGEEEEIWETEKRVRGKMGLGRDTELYVMSEGRRVDWEGLGRIQAGRTVEMGLVTRGGGRKRKTKNGNRWESLASGGERKESDGSGRDSLD